VAKVDAEQAGTDWVELVAVILLSVTAVLTAWTGFQASKWGGLMSISFSQASAARMEASRQEGLANRKQTIQVALFSQWVQANTVGNRPVADYLSARFPEPLKSAFAAWMVTNPGTNAQATRSPFDMVEYVLPEVAAAQSADDRADVQFAAALQANQRGDNYTFLTVAFASVLFFAAMSGKMTSRQRRWTVLGMALALFATATVLLLVLPKRL